MSFPTGRVCASLRGGVLSLDPSVFLLGNSVYAMFMVTESRLVCALRLFASLPWFREVGLQSSFDVVPSRVFLRWVVSTLKKGGNGTFCKSGAYLFCTAYSHFDSCTSAASLSQKTNRF